MRRRRQFSAGFQHFANFGVLNRSFHGRSMRPWNPLLLTSLRAWYDAERGQPKYGGAGAYVQLDGTSGDYIFTPDSAATSFSNDIEVVMRVKVTDWTAAANQTLAGKYVSTGDQRSWRFYVNTSGAIGLTASTDGTAVTSIIVTPTNALPDNTWIWLRMRLDLTNGSNSVGTLETATDTGTNTEPSSWTANGTNTGTTISGIFDSTAPTEIGTFGSGTLERMTGQVGRCIVRSGFSGTTVADFNASDCYGDGYWHSGGYRWTLGLPKIYDRGPNGLAPATFGSGSNQPQWLPWTGRAQVYLPGVANNYLSAGNLDHTGDYTARVHLNHRSIGTDLCELVSDRGTSVGEAALRLTGGTGSLTQLNLLWWESGVARQVTSTGHGLIDGQDAWVGVERINNSGGVYRIRFYKSLAESPSMTDWTGWTLISEHAGPAVAAPSVSTSNTYIGGATIRYTGGIYRVVAANNGVQTIDFVAASCGQTGYTDTLGNVWTVNRSTSGRKTVVQSPTARTARSVIQGATDDRLTVPLAALPTFGTSGVGSVLAVQRKWATLGTNDRVFDSKASTSATAAGFYVGSGGTAADLVANAGDGTNQANSTAATSLVSGQRQVVGITVSATQVQAFVNNTFATAASRPTNSMDSGGDLTVFANSTGAEYSDGRLEAIICRDAEHTATDQGLVVAYYRGGL